jgi:hypothetical protein
MIELVNMINNVLTVGVLGWFITYIIITDYKANKKSKEGRYYDNY